MTINYWQKVDKKVLGVDANDCKVCGLVLEVPLLLNYPSLILISSLLSPAQVSKLANYDYEGKLSFATIRPSRLCCWPLVTHLRYDDKGCSGDLRVSLS